MSDFLPKGWIEKYDKSSDKKVYYNLETKQTFHKKEDLDRYINYITTKAAHLAHAEPDQLWKRATSEDPEGNAVLTNMLVDGEDEMLGSIYVPKETSKSFQSSKGKETLSKIYEEEEEDWSADDDKDDDYTPRKKYKRSQKRKEDGNNDDHCPMTTAPKRQNNFPSRGRNPRGRNSGKAN